MSIIYYALTLYTTHFKATFDQLKRADVYLVL